MVRDGSDTKYLDSLGVEKRIADLRNEAQLAKAVQGVDAIIHTAAYVNFRQDRMTQFTGINTFGAINLYRAATAAGVKRFVQVSSIAAVGGIPRVGGRPTRPVTPMTEDHTFNLDHLNIPYILTKRAAEVELQKLYEHGGPELVIVNPSIVVAPSRTGDDRGKAEKRFRHAILPRLDNLLNLVDIRDVAPAIISGLERGGAGERYILAGENIPAEELVRKVAAMLSINPRLIRIPRPLLNTSAQLAEIWNKLSGHRKQSFYPDLVKMLDYDWAWDNSKAKAELGFAPRSLDLTLTDVLSNSFTGTWMRPM